MSQNKPSSNLILYNGLGCHARGGRKEQAGGRRGDGLGHREVPQRVQRRARPDHLRGVRRPGDREPATPCPRVKSWGCDDAFHFGGNGLSGALVLKDPRPTPSFAHQYTGVQKKGFLVCKQQRKIALISNRHDSGGKNVLLFPITFAYKQSATVLTF